MLTLNQKFYNHWQEVPKSIWIWHNFTPQEIASHGDGSILIDVNALNLLQKLRDYIGKPLIILSAYRDPEHNEEIGGAPKSLHKQGRAFDVSYINQDKDLLYKAASKIGFTGFGKYNNFLHMDTGRPREWVQTM